jgi:hypothetical protein
MTGAWTGACDGAATAGLDCIRLTSCSSVPNARKRIISIVRFVRRNTLFYDEDITALPRLVSAVYVGMKAMEISRYGQHDARSRLVRFSTGLQKLYPNAQKFGGNRAVRITKLGTLRPGRAGRDRTFE